MLMEWIERLVEWIDFGWIYGWVGEILGVLCMVGAWILWCWSSASKVLNVTVKILCF